VSPEQRDEVMKMLAPFLLSIHWANILQMTAAPHFWFGIEKTE
jgi:hypothetical protein